jgi:hypothetical protein
MSRQTALSASASRLRFALSLPLLLAAAGCDQVQGIIQGVPPGSTEVATFTTAQGQQLELMQLPGSTQYDFYAPVTQWQALSLPMLNGLTNITFLGSQALGADTAVLLQASDDTCQNRHILLVIRLPYVQSSNFNGCDGSLTMIPQADGVSLGFRNSEANPSYHYVYRYGVLYGPIFERSPIPKIRHHYKRKVVTPTPGSAPGASVPAQSGTTSQAPVNLDNLDVPAGAPAVNLDK